MSTERMGLGGANLSKTNLVNVRPCTRIYLSTCAVYKPPGVDWPTADASSYLARTQEYFWSKPQKHVQRLHTERQASARQKGP
jgi:hypothetical protein